jgi:hypothetical protein
MLIKSIALFCASPHCLRRIGPKHQPITGANKKFHAKLNRFLVLYWIKCFARMWSSEKLKSKLSRTAKLGASFTLLFGLDVIRPRDIWVATVKTKEQRKPLTPWSEDDLIVAERNAIHDLLRQVVELRKLFLSWLELSILPHLMPNASQQPTITREMRAMWSTVISHRTQCL